MAGFFVGAQRDLLDRLDHVLDDFLGIAKHHHGLVQIEQLVIQAGVAVCN